MAHGVGSAGYYLDDPLRRHWASPPDERSEKQLEFEGVQCATLKLNISLALVAVDIRGPEVPQCRKAPPRRRPVFTTETYTALEVMAVGDKD